MNNSFTLGFNQEKYRQKSTGKIYSLGNNDNIIEEDENENTENDTLKIKSNPINKDKAKSERDNIKTNINNNTSENEAKKRMIENCKKELGNFDRIKKVKKGEVMKKLKLKNISKNEIDISNVIITILLKIVIIPSTIKDKKLIKLMLSNTIEKYFVLIDFL